MLRNVPIKLPAVAGARALRPRDKRRSARANTFRGPVPGGAGPVASLPDFKAIPVAVLVAVLPVASLCAWWNGAF